MIQAVRARGLTKAFEGRTVIRCLELDVEPGSFFGLLGRNGAGKSTFLRMLSGLALPTNGTLEVYGYDVQTEYRNSRRLVGIAQQDVHFDRFFSVIEVLLLQAGYFGIPRQVAYRKAEELLTRFGLWEQRDQPIHHLSGGMKRCLQIAKAIIHEPRLLILDEPTAGVDVDSRSILWSYWADLNKSGVTILLTTHYLEEALALCTSMAVLRSGSIEVVGSTNNVLRFAGGDLKNLFTCRAVTD